jgi:hypothetical protein
MGWLDAGCSSSKSGTGIGTRAAYSLILAGSNLLTQLTTLRGHISAIGAARKVVHDLRTQVGHRRPFVAARSSVFETTPTVRNVSRSLAWSALAFPSRRSGPVAFDA